MAVFEKRTRAAVDESVQQISNWRAWFIGAHVQRLRDNGADEDTVTREQATIVTLADAITARMKSDYLSRRHP